VDVVSSACIYLYAQTSADTQGAKSSVQISVAYNHDEDTPSGNPFRRRLLYRWADSAAPKSDCDPNYFACRGQPAIDPRGNRGMLCGNYKLGDFLSANSGWGIATYRLGVDRGVGPNTYYFGGYNYDTNIARASTKNISRTVILHRPFRSVVELGYVFTDLPWRNVDFFTADSGHAALLDVFCVSDNQLFDAIEEGKVDLNMRQPPVIKTLLAGAYRDELSADDEITGAQAGVLRINSSPVPLAAVLHGIQPRLGRGEQDRGSGEIAGRQNTCRRRRFFLV
jgi:hypothetical protein